MIKQFLIVLSCMIIIGTAGCTVKQSEDTNRKEETANIEEQQKSETPAEADKKDETQQNKISVNLYKINEADGSMISETKKCDTLDETSLWQLLQEYSLVKPDSNIISLEQNGDQLCIDVDRNFGDQLRGLGTTGENELIGCVVNTYLDAYNCSEIMITEEGNTLVSSHKEYAGYMKKFV